ncbi:hypothetical protein, partial [Brevibacterium sp. NPDC056947]|uniref:hypothetical protein n=1 Tax=Brevibacterium sp. NPDC056947 TaxID=3345974 RepID=UPI00363A58C4
APSRVDSAIQAGCAQSQMRIEQSVELSHLTPDRGCPICARGQLDRGGRECEQTERLRRNEIDDRSLLRFEPSDLTGRIRPSVSRDGENRLQPYALVELGELHVG